MCKLLELKLIYPNIVGKKKLNENNNLRSNLFVSHLSNISMRGDNFLYSLLVVVVKKRNSLILFHPCVRITHRIFIHAYCYHQYSILWR